MDDGAHPVSLQSTWSSVSDLPADLVVCTVVSGGASLTAVDSPELPSWCRDAGVKLEKPPSGQRCELHVTFSGVVEVAALEVISTARIVEMYGTTEEEGDSYWQSSRSKVSVKAPTGNAWICQTLFQQPGSSSKTTGSPLVVKLFSLPAPADTCYVHGIRLHLTSRKASLLKDPPPKPSASALGEIAGLAMRFIQGGASLGKPPATDPPPRPEPSPAPPQSAPPDPAPSVASPTTAAAPPPMASMQALATVFQQQMSAQLSAMQTQLNTKLDSLSSRVAVVERAVPVCLQLSDQVAELRREVERLKSAEAEREARALSHSALSTPRQAPAGSPSVTPVHSHTATPPHRPSPLPREHSVDSRPIGGVSPVGRSLVVCPFAVSPDKAGDPSPSRRLQEARMERRGERRSAPPGTLDAVKMLTDLSSSSRLHSTDCDANVTIEEAKKFFGFSDVAMFRKWVGMAALGNDADAGLEEIADAVSPGRRRSRSASASDRNEGSPSPTTPATPERRPASTRSMSLPSAHGHTSPTSMVRGVMACQKARAQSLKLIPTKAHTPRRRVKQGDDPRRHQIPSPVVLGSDPPSYRQATSGS